MEPIPPHREIAEAEARLEWLLAKLHGESLRRGSALTMPILVGGTALRRAYGLTRPSIDLDFAVASEREMKRLVRAIAKIARQRWPGARVALREDGEHGWRITDGDGRPVLHIGGLVMRAESLALAHWTRETWTLPMARLAAMKIRAGLELRSKVRDLYDMGFIAEQYPGDITERQANGIASAGFEATSETNRWAEDHGTDPMFCAMRLAALGQDVVRAASAALAHIEGARNGRWMNQSQAATELGEAALRAPGGTWNTRRMGNQVHVAWRKPDGETAWEAIVESESRARRLPVQAGLEIESSASAATAQRGPELEAPRGTRC